jgi:hypothetical protein
MIPILRTKGGPFSKLGWAPLRRKLVGQRGWKLNHLFCPFWIVFLEEAQVPLLSLSHKAVHRDTCSLASVYFPKFPGSQVPKFRLLFKPCSSPLVRISIFHHSCTPSSLELSSLDSIDSLHPHRSIIPNLLSTLHSEIMSVNGGSTGKASVHGPSSSRHQGLVNVQPARLGDLQPRYAARIQHDDDNPDAHGWYAQMSK